MSIDKSKDLSGREEQAARLVAEDQRSDVEIAAAVGISKRTLERWKKRPLFVARVRELRKAFHKALVAEGIGDRRYRIRKLAALEEALYRIIDERRTDESFQHVPGGRTGLLRRQARIVGGSDNARVVWEYHLDKPLLQELRAIHRQAAEEVEQSITDDATNADLDAQFDALVAQLALKCEHCMPDRTLSAAARRLQEFNLEHRRTQSRAAGGATQMPQSDNDDRTEADLDTQRDTSK